MGRRLITGSESRCYRPGPPGVPKFLARQYWDSLLFCSSRHLSRPPAAGRPRHEGIPYSSQFMILRIDSTES